MIKTERFTLRLLTKEDATQKYQNWLLDSESQRFIINSSHHDLVQIRNYIAERENREDVKFFGIFLRDTSEHIGNIKFEPINTAANTAVLGILVGEREWRGKGVAGEVINAACHWLLHEKNIFKFFLGVNPDNLAARRAYEKIGFRHYDTDADGSLRMVWNLGASRKLAIGTVQFGMNYGFNEAKRTEEEEVRRIISRAFAEGIESLDTAIGYGESETTLGRMPLRNMKIVSKIGAIPEECCNIEKWIDDQIGASLQRLQVNSLYAMLLHSPSELLGNRGERIHNALIKAKKRGFLKKIGISVYDPSELDAICSRYSVDLVQAPMNVLDRRIETSGWMKRLHDAGIELHVRSIFLQGLLLRPPSDLPEKFLKWKSLWSAWDAWLQSNKLSPLAACLQYALGFQMVSRVVVGVENLLQFEQICKAATGPSLQVPEEIQSHDPLLLNPSLWSYL